MAKKNRYERIIERIFISRYTEGSEEILFEREDIVRAATELGIKLPKNIGDIIYSFRYRSDFPEAVASRAPQGKCWIIRSAGRSCYRFVATSVAVIAPNASLSETKIPDATPGVIEMYALSDEQALLAKLRYNRLVDIFTGTACYSLQSHLRTSVPRLGQVETDEIYIGIDRRGTRYIFPIQAKGGKDRLSVVQIEQDMALCSSKFPSLVCRPIAAQFMENNLIALFEFEEGSRGIAIAMEKHYRLAPPENMTTEEIDSYRQRTPNG